MYGHKKAVVANSVNDPRGMILPDKTFYVEGSLPEVYGMTLNSALMHNNWAARHYETRAKRNGLPTDNSNDLYYGKIDGLGHILHRSEFEYQS